MARRGAQGLRESGAWPFSALLQHLLTSEWLPGSAREPEMALVDNPKTSAPACAFGCKLVGKLQPVTLEGASWDGNVNLSRCLLFPHSNLGRWHKYGEGQAWSAGSKFHCRRWKSVPEACPRFAVRRRGAAGDSCCPSSGALEGPGLAGTRLSKDRRAGRTQPQQRV